MQQDEYQNLLGLCKDVIPITWNAFKYCDIANRKKERGILNIELHIYDKPICDKMPKSLGHVGGIQYLNGIASCKISIHCYPPMRTQTLLHELAHIAVFRLESLITKSYKSEFSLCDGTILDPDFHGKIFFRFFDIFENRAIKKGWSFFVVKGRKVWIKNKANS